MKSIHRQLLIIIVIFLLSGCVALTKSTIPFKEAVIENDETALLYIYYNGGAVRSFWPINIDLNDEYLGKMLSGAYFTLNLPTDYYKLHYYFFPDTNKYYLNQILSFRIKAGNKYYLRLDGFGAQLISEDEALQELINMKWELPQK